MTVESKSEDVADTQSEGPKTTEEKIIAYILSDHLELREGKCSLNTRGRSRVEIYIVIFKLAISGGWDKVEKRMRLFSLLRVLSDGFSVFLL